MLDKDCICNFLKHTKNVIWKKIICTLHISNRPTLPDIELNFDCSCVDEDQDKDIVLHV